MPPQSEITMQDRLPEGRKSERVELLIETDGRFCADVEAKVFLHNISSTGVLIETERQLQSGQNIQLDLPEAGPVDFSVVWGNEGFYGCRATTALPRAVLSAAKLRNLLPASVLAPPSKTADMGLARRLRHLRESKGFSLAALSRESGISKPSIWAWETGKTMPRPRSINALADALGVNSATIWGRESPEAQQPPMMIPVGGYATVENIVAEARRAIAAAAGVRPQQVKIGIEL